MPIHAVAVSEELVKTIAKLEGEYKAADLKLEIAKDSTILPLKQLML
jgi:HAE1 family hydrophobic/amphiphilic exporter-1